MDIVLKAAIADGPTNCPLPQLDRAVEQPGATQVRVLALKSKHAALLFVPKQFTFYPRDAS